MDNVLLKCDTIVDVVKKQSARKSYKDQFDTKQMTLLQLFKLKANERESKYEDLHMEFTFVQDMSFREPYVQFIYAEKQTEKTPENGEFAEALNYSLVIYNFETGENCSVSIQPPEILNSDIYANDFTICRSSGVIA